VCRRWGAARGGERKEVELAMDRTWKAFEPSTWLTQSLIVFSLFFFHIFERLYRFNICCWSNPIVFQQNFAHYNVKSRS
jgi:hypothetical protein